MVELPDHLKPHAFFFENFGVPPHDCTDCEYLSLELYLILSGFEHQSQVLAGKQILLLPEAEEVNLWHQVQIWPIERVLSFLVLKNE